MVDACTLRYGFLVVALAACGGGGGGETTDGSVVDGSVNPTIDGSVAVIDAEDRADAAPLGPGVTTLAGWAQPGSEDGPRDVASFNNPVNVEVGPDGNIYVADFDNSIVRKVTPFGDVTTIVDQFDFLSPFGIAFTTDGTMYVQTDGNDMGFRDRTTGTIWRVDTVNGGATLVVRDIGRPRGLAALPDGRLVIVDINTHVVRLLDPDAANPTPIPLAGMVDTPGDVDDTGSAARFNQPYGAVVTAGGDILVADQLNHKIRRVTLAGVVSTFAGFGQAGNRDGAALGDAKFNAPQDIAIDDLGNVYVSDADNFTLRMVDTNGQVSTIAGSGVQGYFDGPPLDAELFGMEGVAVTDDGTLLYLADGNRGMGGPYHRIRRLDLTTPVDMPDAGPAPSDAAPSSD